MSIIVDELLREIDDRHLFIVMRLSYDSGWLEVLAEQYIEMRSQIQALLSQVTDDGVPGFDMSNLMARIKEAAIPYPERNPKRKNFSIIRSDLGEALNYVLLEQTYATKFAVNLVADRELVSAPGRGIDAIGIEEDTDVLRLVFSEVKVSSDRNSPPSVVDGSDDSMHHQHLGHVSNRKITANKIINAATKAKTPEIKALFLRAALLFEVANGEMEVVAHCFLVRPEACYTPADFGKFKNNPSAYTPANVRFAIACVPEDIDKVETSWYDTIVRVGGLDRE